MTKTRKIFAPVIAVMMVLAMMVSGASALDNWDTTTVGLNVSTDVPAIDATTGRVLNLTIEGLDSLGNVDIYGVAGGSTIIASVTTLLGNAITMGVGTGLSPAASGTGTLAALTRYITLGSGVGYANVGYANNAAGTDVVTVKLYERRTDASATNVETRLIATNTTNVEVASTTMAASILNIESFTKATGDTSGRSGNAVPTTTPASLTADIGYASGQARMTANAAGGILGINAYVVSSTGAYALDTSAGGTVTVTLTGDPAATETIGNNRASSATVYTTTGTMQNGVAQVSIPSGFTAAGRYTVTADLDGVGSVPSKVSDATAAIDYMWILPSATPVSVGMSCDRAVISNTPGAQVTADVNDDGISFDPTFSGKLLDAYGNKIAAQGYAGAVVKVTDANAKIADFNITIAANANAGTLLVDSSTFTAGLASLSAAVPLNTLLTASAAYPLKTVASSNQMILRASGQMNSSDLNATATKVGTSFQFFLNGIGVDNVVQNGSNSDLNAAEMATLLATDSIKVTNLTANATGTYETCTVGVTNGAPDNIQALFSAPITSANAIANGFLVQHVGQSYADFVITPQTDSALAVQAGSAAKAYVKDGAGAQATTIVPLVIASGQFVATIDGSHVSMKDAYGNTNNAGTLTVTSTQGTVAGTITPGTGGTTAVITYPAGTTGTDALTFTFTQPGISSVNDGNGVTVSFPVVSTLASFDTLPAGATQTMSVNGALPLTIFPRTAAGSTFTVAAGYFVDYDTTGLTLQTAAGAAFTTGNNVGANTGRLPLRVIAGSIPGVYDVTVRSIDGTITQTLQYNVVEYTVPLALGASAVEIAASGTSDIEISGGQSPYSVASADDTVATASIAGSTLTVTGVAEGGPVDITVTDADGTTAVVAVTVGEAAPTAVGGTETGDIEVAANVATSYAMSLNTTPEAGDTAAQEWIIIGGTNGVSGTVWYFAYNGTDFVVDLDSTTAAYVGELVSPFLVHPGVNLAALGYTAAGGGDLYCAYAYSTEATGTFKDLLDAGKVVMNNVTDLVIPE
ncbi:MAG: hypothetical protein JEZ12_11720 [Desulfobacterium sp.]|nr:hypothetical protein [Desulfobacterium sp.]